MNREIAREAAELYREAAQRQETLDGLRRRYDHTTVEVSVQGAMPSRLGGHTYTGLFRAQSGYCRSGTLEAEIVQFILDRRIAGELKGLAAINRRLAQLGFEAVKVPKP